MTWQKSKIRYKPTSFSMSLRDFIRMLFNWKFSCKVYEQHDTEKSINNTYLYKGWKREKLNKVLFS